MVRPLERITQPIHGQPSVEVIGVAGVGGGFARAVDAKVCMRRALARRATAEPMSPVPIRTQACPASSVRPSAGTGSFHVRVD